MSDENSTAILPQENSDFVPNDGKNATKVVFDMEHNAAFIQEFKEKMELCGSSNDIDLLKSEFKKMTGVDFDELCPPEAEEQVSEEPVADETESPAAETKEFTEEPAETAEEPTPETVEVKETTDDELEDALLKKALSQVDEYMTNPTKLKFTEDDINKIVKIGMFDFDTIKMLVEKMNEDLDLIEKGITDEESPYHDENVRREAIINQLKIKISTTEACEAASQLTSPEIIKEIFNSNYPEYETKGPAYIMEKFAAYLNSRMVNEAETIQLARELNNYQKLTEIFDRANADIFDNLMMTNNKKYTVGVFIKSVFMWNRSLIAKLFGITEDHVDMKQCESLLVTFTTLFVRFMYKNIVPEMKRRPIQRMLMQRFIYDNSNPLSLSGEKFENLTKSWEHVLELTAKVAIEASKLQKTE